MNRLIVLLALCAIGWYFMQGSRGGEHSYPGYSNRPESARWSW